ncbi:MAG: hypothetical protein PHY44_00690 [Lachnospiraceae bacterium]|nr:hypothetical protein [Lachnospiraceae bacterium]
MKNKKYYPFERNNYFYGKLLTVRDFEDEQKYVNDKRRLQNFLTNGAGVVCGLNTIALDDKTISIEAGMALDYQGREIVMEESITKKLNVIDGFYEIEDTDNVYLCLSYNEENKELMHSIAGNQQEQGNNYNRIAEGYRLFLTSYVNENAILSMDRLKNYTKVIFEKKGLKITQKVPAYVKGGQAFEITVEVEKTNLPRAVELDYIIESDYIKSAEGSNIRVYYCDDDITAYKKTEIKFSAVAKDVEDADAILTINPSDSRISIGSEKETLEEKQKMFLKITKDSMNEAVISRYFEKHFDDVLNLNVENSIYLAKFRIIKRGSDYSIVDFDRLPFKQYVLSNSMLYLLMNEEKNSFAIKEKEAIAVPLKKEKQELPKEEKPLVNGTETIYIDLKCKNKVYFSDEIAHGLGKGNVLISTAVEEKSEGNAIYDQDKAFFGDMSILTGSMFDSYLPKVSVAVISYPQKGTFRIAVKCLEDSQYTSVGIQWWAVKNESTKINNPTEVSGVSVAIVPDTIKIAPREKFKFNAEVNGTDNQECRWYVTEEKGGEIDIHGVYEAPTQEGVYEISVESVKYPNKKATAFVVVKQR